MDLIFNFIVLDLLSIFHLKLMLIQLIILLKWVILSYQYLQIDLFYFYYNPLIQLGVHGILIHFFLLPLVYFHFIKLLIHLFINFNFAKFSLKECLKAIFS
jgi:hypothetical protein